MVAAQFGEHLYVLKEEPVDFDAALTVAEESMYNGRVGHVLTIETAEENEFVTGQSVSGCCAHALGLARDNLWLAASDGSTEGLLLLLIGAD